MINNIRVTEFQIEAQAKWWQDHQQASCPATEDKPLTDLAVHDGDIMQGFADGYISVIGHDGQEKKLCHTKKISKKYLSGTVVICDCLVTCGDVV